MLELFWTLLNISILLYFFILCFKVIRIVREKLGILPTFFFIIVFLSIFSNSDVKNNIMHTSENKSQNERIVQNKNEIKKTRIILEDLYATTAEITITYKVINQEPQIINSNIHTWGLVGSIDWKFINISLDKDNNNLYQYKIYVKKVWRILSIPIYSETKVFEGNTTF